MSRYLERAEHCARVIEVNLNLMLDHTSMTPDERWTRVAASLGFPNKEKLTRDVHSLTRTMALDSTARSSSILSCIVLARENARQIREQISSEMWEQLNRLFFHVKLASEADGPHEPMEFLDSVKEGAHLFQGLTDSTMSHNEGWQFIQFGRFIERASATAGLLDIQFSHFFGDESETDERPAHGEHLEWIGLLRSCTAFEAYCKVYTADVKLNRIAEFLLLNAEFPHAVRFSVDQMSEALSKIACSAPGRNSRPVEKLAGRLRASLSFTQIEEILEGGAHEYLKGIQRQCNQIHASVQQTYIAYPIQFALEA
jgi:uncharacterized alpha-E superfamily protein